MASTTISAEAGSLRPTPPLRLQYLAAIWLYLLTLLGSHLATPLYPTYQLEFGLSTGAISFIYACYPIGVTIGLLWGGRLGDQLGRKPLLLAGILLTTIACGIYLIATGMTHLVVARLINGLAVGLMSGPVIAAMIELHPKANRADASRAGSIVTLASPALGLLAATVIVYAAPPSTILTLPFLGELAALLLAFALFFLVRETIRPENRKQPAEVSWKPQGVRVPAGIRQPFFFAAITGMLCWANTGIWLGLGPSMVYDVVGSDNRMLGGLSVVAFLSTAGIVQVFSRGMRYARSTLVGLLLVAPSLILIVITLRYQSGAGLVLGAIMAGAAQGFGWMGSSELTNKIAPQDLRASVLSALYICGYIGSSIPPFLTGMVADQLGVLKAIESAAIVLVTLSLVLLWWRPKALARVEPTRQQPVEEKIP